METYDSLSDRMTTSPSSTWVEWHNAPHLHRSLEYRVRTSARSPTVLLSPEACQPAWGRWRDLEVQFSRDRPGTTGGRASPNRSCGPPFFASRGTLVAILLGHSRAGAYAHVRLQRFAPGQRHFRQHPDPTGRADNSTPPASPAAYPAIGCRQRVAITSTDDVSGCVAEAPCLDLSGRRRSARWNRVCRRDFVIEDHNQPIRRIRESRTLGFA